MADKAEARAAKAAASEGIHTKGFGRNADAFFLGALTHDAVVVRRTGCLKVHFCALAEIVEPVQHVFVFLRGDDLIGQANRIVADAEKAEREILEIVESKIK